MRLFKFGINETDLSSFPIVNVIFDCLIFPAAICKACVLTANQIKEMLNLDQLRQSAISRAEKICEQTGLFKEMVCFILAAITRHYLTGYQLFLSNDIVMSSVGK